VQLDTPLEMISVMRLLYTRLGLCCEDGKPSWPRDSIEIPSEEELDWIIYTALPRTASDRMEGASAGVRAWNSTFPSTPWSADKLGPLEVIELVLGLVGISVAPSRRYSAGRVELFTSMRCR
jgi:hypothetical protein